MSIYTKKAIMDSFVKMLSQKSFDKITIKDIIEDCGLNRSTFYYYTRIFMLCWKMCSKRS